MATITFSHHGINLDGETKKEKIDSYINQMGGPAALFEYVILNLRITEDNISEIQTIE